MTNLFHPMKLVKSGLPSLMQRRWATFLRELPPKCCFLKMADIFHIQGHAVNERKYHEIIYGRFERVDCNDVNCKA